MLYLAQPTETILREITKLGWRQVGSGTSYVYMIPPEAATETPVDAYTVYMSGVPNKSVEERNKEWRQRRREWRKDTVHG